MKRKTPTSEENLRNDAEKKSEEESQWRKATLARHKARKTGDQDAGPDAAPEDEEISLDEYGEPRVKPPASVGQKKVHSASLETM